MDKIKAFSLVEMTLVIGLFIAIMAVVFPFSIQNMNVNKAENMAKLFVAKIFTQQQKAYTQTDNYSYGIQIGLNSLNIYQGFSTDNIASSETLNLENGIVVKAINLNSGDNKIHFNKGSVRPLYYGTINIGDDNNTYVITINSEGLIAFQRQ